MSDGGFGVFGRLRGMTGFAVLNRFLQMLNALIQMRILHASSLRMLQRFLGMLRRSIGMPLLAVIYRALGMLNSFTHVFVVCLRHYWQAKQCDHCEYRRSTSGAHRHGFLLMVWVHTVQKEIVLDESPYTADF